VPRLVLEVQHGSNTVIISKFYGGPRQLWDFDGDGTILSRFGNVMDIRGGNTEPINPSSPTLSIVGGIRSSGSCQSAGEKHSSELVLSCYLGFDKA